MILAVLNKTRNEDGIVPGRYWWGGWEIRKSVMLFNEDGTRNWKGKEVWTMRHVDGHFVERKTLREVREYLGQTKHM